MFGQEIVGERVGERGTEETQDQSSQKEWHGVGRDLFIDCAEAQVMPIESRAVRSAEQESAHPIGGAEDRDYGPGIIEGGADHEGKKIQTQGPGAEEHHYGVKAIGRGKGDEDSHGEGQRRSLR